MEEWIRCNKCYREIKDSSKNFVLKQCQHVFCHQCNMPNKCPECKASEVADMIIQKPLQQSLVPYFQRIDQQLPLLGQAAELQRTQASMLLRRSESLASKCKEMEKSANELMNVRAAMQYDNKKIREDIEILKEKLRRRKERAEEAQKAKYGSGHSSSKNIQYSLNNLSLNGQQAFKGQNRREHVRVYNEEPAFGSQYYPRKVGSDDSAELPMFSSHREFQQKTPSSAHNYSTTSSSNISSSGRTPKNYDFPHKNYRSPYLNSRTKDSEFL